MPTINQLPVLNTISSGDQLPVYSPNNGDARRTSIGSLLTYFQQTFASPTLSTNLYVPGTGFNITVPTPVSNDQWMLLQPAGTLAAGTITLPLNTGVPDGTTVLITTTQEITSLTLALNGASAIFGGVTYLAAGTATAIRFYQPTNSWYQINAETTYGANIQVFLATPSSANLRAAMTDETGTGVLVFNTSPTLVTPTLTTPTLNNPTMTAPVLGTVTSGNISNCTSTSMVMVSPVLGTPTSGNLSNCTALPIGSVTGLAANVATFLATPSSANLAAARTDETGTGANVFATGPTFDNINGSVQALGGPGAVNLTTYTTAFTSTAAGNALTLADGAQGQIKNIVYVAEAAGGDTGVLTPTNLGAGTTITFNAVGDSCQLQFIGTDWWAVSLRGAVLA